MKRRRGPKKQSEANQRQGSSVNKLQGNTHCPTDLNTEDYSQPWYDHLCLGKSGKKDNEILGSLYGLLQLKTILTKQKSKQLRIYMNSN